MTDQNKSLGDILGGICSQNPPPVDPSKVELPFDPKRVKAVLAAMEAPLTVQPIKPVGAPRDDEQGVAHLRIDSAGQAASSAALRLVGDASSSSLWTSQSCYDAVYAGEGPTGATTSKLKPYRRSDAERYEKSLSRGAAVQEQLARRLALRNFLLTAIAALYSKRVPPHGHNSSGRRLVVSADSSPALIHAPDTILSFPLRGNMSQHDTQTPSTARRSRRFGKRPLPHRRDFQKSAR